MKPIILTLPMMPVDSNNYGKFVTPIVCETLKNVLNGKYYHCVNILDSFNDRSKNIEQYVKSLNENHIYYDYLWYDYNYISKLLFNINVLIKKGYIFELNSNVYRCDCGIVEIEKNKISTCNPNNLKFYYKDGNMICKFCGKICHEYDEKILVFMPNKIKLSDINILPSYLEKDIKTYEKTILNSYITVSRNRNTGVQINYNGRKYNVDIDFLWATYLNLFEEQEKIVVSGNKMIYQLFLTFVLEKCLNQKSNTFLLGTPYITNIKDIYNEHDFINDEYLRKLFVLFSMKWQKKEIIYDNTILRYLKNISPDKRKNLYDIINREYKFNCNFSDYKNLELMLKKQINMQETVKTLKIEGR